MRFQSIIATLAALVAPMTVVAKSQDYARHIELSLLFYEAQRSGKLPENNRVYWRHDSMLDAGADNNVDLTGGYYDAGDNVKFNFPQAAALTLLAWSGIDYAEGYESAGQMDYLLDAVKWGADYFMKCHTSKDELYVQVGRGTTDHAYWYPPEYIQYDYPSYKLTPSKPGTEVSADTASFLAASSILFKNVDPSYSQSCLKHAIEIYDFADTYRGDYTGSVPDVSGFYSTWSGYNDELAFGALWLYRATGDESYLTKFKAIADAVYGAQDTKAYGTCTGPISWDDKRPGAYILAAILTGDESRMQKAFDYCDNVLTQPTTPAGLWYDANLSKWASNRYASNAAAMLAMLANSLPKGDARRAKYVDFVKFQTDYILGDNPAGVNYVVGAEANSPKAVHHRGASGTYDSQDVHARPNDYNVFTLWGALAGGPSKDDTYSDTRKDYEMNEVALDYNAAFQMNLAFLCKEGLSKPDPDSVKVHDRSFPKKAETPDITVTVNGDKIDVATGSGMLCSSWCLEFNTDFDIDLVHHSIMYQKDPKYIICNQRETNFLDGEGTPQTIQYQGKVQGKPEINIENVVVMCDGWHAPQNGHKTSYKPENGRRYEIVNGGGVGNTIPLFEQTECWPGFLCSGSSTPTKTTTIKKTTTAISQQTSSNNDCFAIKLGYSCCNNNEIVYVDADGNWGFNGNDWCGIGGSSSSGNNNNEKCGDYACCSGCDVAYTDAEGNWGVENGDWCKIVSSKCNTQAEQCNGAKLGYSCCSSCNTVYTDADGKWGVENGDWCSIKNSC